MSSRLANIQNLERSDRMFVESKSNDRASRGLLDGGGREDWLRE